jgi:hypothetical protein
MRWLACVTPLILLASNACDNKQDATTAAAASASAYKGAPPPPAVSMTASTATAEATQVTGDAGAKTAATVPMPERPVPRPQTMVGSTMPIEVQQKAISYMVAMRAPHLDDAPADPTYAGDLVAKLKPIALAMDTGGDKARMNRVESVANGRQIDLLMSGGCDDKTPIRAAVTRAGVPLAALVSHGVLVLRCNDARIQCLQSTRDPDDVLCTTAPRHK